MTAVTVLVIAGTAQSLVSLGSLRGLYGTTYGRLLLLKIGILALVLAVAWYSRRLTLGPLLGADTRAGGASEADADPEPEIAEAEVAGVRLVESKAGAGSAAAAARRKAVIRAVPPPQEGDAGPDGDGADGVESSRRRLRRSVLLELVGTVVVLALTSALVQTTPARAALEQAASQQSGAYSATLTTKLYSLQVQIEGKRTGANTIHLYAFTPDGATLSIKEWKATAALPAQGIEPVDVPVLPISDNHAVAQAQLSTAGTWQLRFTLRTSDIDAATVIADVPVT
jgi:copper transport protein